MSGSRAMATLTHIDLDLPEAKRYADLAGVRFDIEQARRFAHCLIEFHDPNGPNSDISESLTISMIMSYARIFTDGVRTKFAGELLDQLSQEERELHDLFMNWRHKHISHSVNSYERNQPVARYFVETVREQGIVQVGVRSHRITVPGSAETYGLISLLDRYWHQIRALYEEEHLRVLAIVRQRPIDEILRGPSRSREAGDQPIEKKRRP